MLKRSNKRRVESAYTQHYSVQPLHARHSLRSCHPGQASRSLYRSAALPVRNSNSVVSGQRRWPLSRLEKKIRSRRLAAAANFFSKRFISWAFFENRKNSGLTPGQNDAPDVKDDPNDRVTQ